MKGFKPPMRYHPGRWVGVTFGFNDAMFNWMKTNLIIKAWDPETKTWWFPEDLEPLVRDAALSYGVTTRPALAAWDKVMASKLKIPETEAEALNTLCLTPGAPPELIDIVAKWWERQWGSAGGTMVKVSEVRAAAEILTGRVPE